MGQDERREARHVSEEGSAQLPVPVVKEGDEQRQQEVIALLAPEELAQRRRLRGRVN